MLELRYIGEDWHDTKKNKVYSGEMNGLFFRYRDDAGNICELFSRNFKKTRKKKEK